MNKVTINLLITIAIYIFGCGVSISAEQNTVKSEQAEITLLGGSYTESKAALALHIKMQPGWHIYWRTPGDTGFSPTLDWTDSKNIDGAEFLWPAPKRIRQELTPDNFIESYVYDNEVTLPINLIAESPQKPLDIKLHLSYAICAEICIPGQAALSIILQPGYKSETNTHKIEAAMQLIPQANNTAGLKIESIKKNINNGGKQFLEISAINANADFVKDATIFIEGGNDFAFNNPSTQISRNTAKFIVPITYLTGKKDFSDAMLKVTLVNGINSVELTANSNDIESAPISDTSYAVSILFLMLAFGFIGGLILNIMPCVLPILSIKLFGIMKQGGGTKTNVRSSFLFTALGIFLSFITFAIITIWLKSVGEVVGWGLHFQQPYFIITLVIILTLFAANLWGLYEIKLPGFLGRIGTKQEGALGHLMSGIFATILATPCTAPFLGVAIGFAVTQGSLEILAIFTAMAIGFAFPYLLFSIFPSIVTKLPKPGEWMLTVKKIMGGLLALSAVWLIWVLSNQLGMMAAIVLFLLCIAKVIKLWAANHFECVEKLKIPLLVFIVILSFTIPIKISNYMPAIEANQDMWESFKPGHIQQLVGSGKIVFVDVTADWCLTCKVNKLAVLDRDYIKKIFLEKNVVAMKADWTNRNNEISEYLKKYQRAGIPFNIVYGPNAPEGVVLSELLSKKEVLDALDMAK